MKRTFETVEVILGENVAFQSEGKTSVEFVEKRKDLREKCFGAFEGQQMQDFKAAVAKSGVKKPWEYSAEGVEDMVSLYTRCAKFFKVSDKQLYAVIKLEI